MENRLKILIVNPLFRSLFLSKSQEILTDQYEVIEFFQQIKKADSNHYGIIHKVINLYNIYILKKNDYYKKIKKRRQENYYKSCLNNINNMYFDKILFCRGDRLPIFVLDELSKKSKKMINYQCDGIEMCPGIFKRKDYFTKIYSFERNDILNYPELKMDFLTNFYFENNNRIISNDVEFDFYYLGVGIQQRIIILSNLDLLLSSYKKRFLLSYHKQKERHNSIEYFIDSIDYNTNLENTKNSTCLIDLKLDNHNGLSFRFFEALYFQKKIITNNKDVINYDFYHKNNILVVDYKKLSLNEIEEFLRKDNFIIEKKIIEKYSFNNWLKIILDLE